jgi:hypothetical protein
MTRSGHERRSIVDDGFNVLSASTFSSEPPIIAATPTADLS